MIEIQDVSKQFDCVTALRHLTLKVQDGSVFGLVGSNGAGKSTLLRILAGVYRPDSGRVLINGQAPFENEQVKRSTVFISDYPYLAPTATVRRLARLYRSVYPGWSEDYFARMEKLFPISFDARLGKMSKGMQRQAAILLGLSTQPRCILFDEIFDGLDPVVRSEILDIFLEFISDGERSILVSSHITSDLERIADYITFIHQGKVLLSENKDEILYGYGIAKAGREQLRRVDRTLVAAIQDTPYGSEALITDRERFEREYPDIVLDPVDFDEMMVLLCRGQKL